jgi:hypothetical protein
MFCCSLYHYLMDKTEQTKTTLLKTKIIPVILDLDYFEGKHYGITTKDWITSGLLVVGNSMRNRFLNVYSHLKQVLVTS